MDDRNPFLLDVAPVIVKDQFGHQFLILEINPVAVFRQQYDHALVIIFDQLRIMLYPEVIIFFPPGFKINPKMELLVQFLIRRFSID